MLSREETGMRSNSRHTGSPAGRPDDVEWTRPVVTEHLQGLEGVVVGDDGSPTARSSVIWAAEDAGRRGSSLHIVRAWTLTTMRRPAAWDRDFVRPLPDWERAALAELDATWRDLRDLAPKVALHAVHGQAAPILVEASRAADLLVVGARGHSRVASLLLGSVAETVTRQADCPVVIVPPAEGRHGHRDTQTQDGSSA
jgi:nucleotide-binding universal stress UspA family protein